MPLLRDLSVGAISDEPDKKIDAIVSHLNEWGKEISNENTTRVMKRSNGKEGLVIGQQSDESTAITLKDSDGLERIKFGETSSTTTGLLLTDSDGDRRILLGELPDGTMGLVISKEGVDVYDVFD